MAFTELKKVDPTLKKIIADLATDFFADKEEISITKFNVDVLKKNGIDYKEYVTSGKSALKRFLMLFPEILTVVEKNVNGGPQYYCYLAKNAHNSMKHKLINIVEQNGGKILLSSIAPELTKQYGVDYKEYSGGKGLLVWLKDEFGDVFDCDDVYCFSKASIHEKILQALTDLIESNDGKFLLAFVGRRLLADHGIDYKKHSGGLTLQPWLRRDFPNDFIIDGYNLLLANHTTPVKKGMQEEITQMHAMAFMSWWINNAKILQRYTGQTRSSEEWSAIVARSFSLALLGETSLFCYEIEDVTKIVFNTGIKTAQGNSLFCVLRPNPNNKSGNLQPYAMEGFCCVAEEDNTLSNEIKQNVPDILKSENVIDEKYEELRNDLDILISQQEKISSFIPELSNRIADGTSIDADIFNSIKSYYDKWIHIKDVIEYLGWDTENEAAINISYLVKRLEYTNRRSDALKKAVELFVEFAGSLLEYCRIIDGMSDIISNDIKIAQKATLEQYDDFKNLLFVYTRLMNITEYDSITNELAESIEFVNGHFKNLITMPIFRFAFYKKTAEEMSVSSKNIPTYVLELLSQLDLTSSNDEDLKEKYIPDCDELLNNVIYHFNTTSLSWQLLSIRWMCSTKLEKAIVMADYDQCRVLISNGDQTDDCQKSPEELLGIIDELEETGTSLTLYECGNRLLEAVGNDNRTAEKFFICGLASNPIACSQALIDLYISENETENFYTVWTKYGQYLSLSAENTRFLLYTLCSKGEDVLKQYLKKNVYIFYNSEYARSLLEVLSEFNYVELLDVCKKRIAYISSIPATNDFEDRVLKMSGNIEVDSVIGFVNSFFPLAESYGYTNEELEKMLIKLEAYKSSEILLNPISRLYDLQGDKNRTVEKLAWNSLADEFSEEICVILLNVLMNAERYDEVCELFECYEEQLTKASEAREIYIRVLIKTGNSRTYAFLTENMQDCLNLFKKNVLSEADLERLTNASSESDSVDVSLLCEKIAGIAKYSDDLVIRSIVGLTDDLRDLAISTGKLVEFGLSTKQVENFVSIYKTDSFPRERDVLSLAKRLYLFIGSHEATKEFALFAYKCGFDAVPLLWEIYTDTNDIDAKFELLSTNPEIRKGKEQEYCTLLLQKNEYEQFLSEVQKLNADSQELVAQIAIAKCYLRESIADELAYLKNGIKEVSHDSFNKLIFVMADMQMFGNIEDLIVDRFDELISLYSAGEIEIIVTANGKLPADSLKIIQKAASAKGSQKLAIYIHETFGVGRLKGASKSFLEESLLEYKNSDKETQVDLLGALKTIYAKNQEYFTKIVLCEIANILSSDSDTERVCTEIERAISGVKLSSEGVSSFTHMLKAYKIPVTVQICKNIISMCTSSEMKKECLEFLNSVSLFNSLLKEKEIDILYMLCRMYADAVTGSFFDKNWMDNAISVCSELFDTNFSYDAAYCIYNIQKTVGNTTFAKFNLLTLLDNKHKIPPEFLPEFNAEADRMKITEKTCIFDLFVEMAETSGLNEIVEYCEYCGNFIQNNKALVDYYKENIREVTVDSYSAESCEVLLKLLYTNPGNGEYWYHCANMPLEEHPGVYAKLLYKASLLNNKESMWKKCIDACERHSQEDLLMDVLIDCATNISMPFGLQNFRIILAEKVNTNPLYFSTLDNNRLADLISIICARMEKDPGVRGNHNALRDLSAIAISTNSKEAYSTMMDYVDEYIFGENCNVGFAIACRLILSKRLDEAKPIIERLSSIAAIKYKKLISKLAAMSIEELSTWSLEKVNQQLLNMILPDGNYPDIHKINDFALSYASGDKAEAGALLICELLDNIPSDYGCYMALFILCKQLPHRIDILHKALCGLVENKPMGNSQSYYTRTKKDFAVLLANVNAIIISQQINDRVAAFDGYDFTKTTWEYYQRCEGNIGNVSDLNDIQEAYSTIENALKNSSSERKELIYSLVFGHVTGNWSNFLEQCWSKQENMTSYLEYYSKFDTGITRSILNVVYSIPESEQRDFIDWIQNNKTTASSKQLETAVNLYQKEYYTKIPLDILEGNILELPFEENSVFEHIFRNTVSQLISKAPNYVHPCAMLVGYLACSNNAMSELWKHAMIAFEASNDTVANRLFAVMSEINRKEHVYHGYVNNTYKPGAMYESMMRITGVFAENENMITAVSKSSFNSWSCINMVLALLYTTRANEVSRIKQHFSDENKHLTDVILTVINKNISDNDKLDAIRSISNEVSRGIVFFIVRCPNMQERQYFFLRERESVQSATESLERIASNHPGFFDAKLQPTHFIWVEPARINEKAYRQIETDTEKTNFDVIDVSTTEETLEGRKLSFVSLLEPISESDCDKSIEELWEEHEKIHSYGMENYKHRVSLTKKIYQLALGNNTDDKLLNDYAIRYGVDYYYYCMGNKDYSLANRIVIEMVNAFDSGSSLDGARMLKSTICNTALHELLHRGYSTIHSLVEAYIENKPAFIKMRNMLPASTMSVELNDVNCIYAALETIAKCLRETADSHTSAFEEALTQASKQLNELKSQWNQGWSTVKGSVVTMIREEINRLALRAIISVEIINKSSNEPAGFIYGQMKNMGREIAENITIQLSYDNGVESDIYELPKLGKGESAVFEILYSSAPGTERLNYEIIVFYDSRGERCSYKASDSLTIEEKEFKTFDTDLYLTDRPITEFSLLEDGTVYSEDFYGREEEKKKINAIFSKKGFANYKNVLIKGIRRAGKTSILNYLLKYANLKCDDAIAVFVSCLGVKANNSPIHRTLIDSVIKECRMLNVGNISDSEWDSFAQKWALPKEQTDCDADNLQYFYRELKTLNGNKGLMLIIDEFDILIEEVAENQGVDSTLFPSLREILTNPYCQDAIHLVVCGSTKLIRYMDGGTLNQFFQQFGDNIIEIGRLLEKEMEIMLTDPYKEYPEVKFERLALDWMWKFTSGLVWYSKLVAGCALNRALKNKRSVVYPSDIVDAVTTVAGKDDYFKNLKESCNPKEIKVLDAIQSLTSKATEYVTISKLLDLLSDDFGQRDIEDIVITLESMQILERNPFDRYSYRFTVELYWHYFRGASSNYHRCEETPVIFRVKQTLQPSRYGADRFDK